MDWRIVVAIATCGVLAATSIYLQKGIKDATAMRRLAYGLFPLSQLLTVVILFGWIIMLDLPDWMFFLAAGVTIACCPIDIVLFKKLQQVQDREFAEARVRMLAEQLEIQKRYNTQLQEDMAKVEDIRRNAEREFKRAAQLIAQDDVCAVSGLFRSMQDAVGDQRFRYCANSTIDVIVSIKHADCISAGIDADFALDVPYEVPSISDVELCAVFSNLLDNALEAAKRFSEEGKGNNAFVEMTSTVKGNILVVATKNSMSNAQGSVQMATRVKREKRSAQKKRFKSIEDHGWGLSIVEEIVARHGGTLVTNAENGVFQASALLVLDEAMAA